MNTTLHLREIVQEDWKVLLDWRNDQVTRHNSFASEIVSERDHKKYIKDTIVSPMRSQFIIEYNGVPAGTIREDKCGSQEFDLSYTISPLFRGKKIGQILMSLYLIDRAGVYICKVKEENIGSIKMIERVGFKFFANENGALSYKMIKPSMS